MPEQPTPAHGWIAVSTDPATWPTLPTKSEDGGKPGVEVLSLGYAPYPGLSGQRIVRFEGKMRYSDTLMWWDIATLANIKVTHWQYLPASPTDPTHYSQTATEARQRELIAVLTARLLQTGGMTNTLRARVGAVAPGLLDKVGERHGGNNND